MTVETVTGKSATIEFNGALCVHARRCVLSEPGVFKANVQGPWIDPGRGERGGADARRLELSVRRDPGHPPAAAPMKPIRRSTPSGARERAARGQRGDRAQGRADRNQSDALPLRASSRTSPIVTIPTSPPPSPPRASRQPRKALLSPGATGRSKSRPIPTGRWASGPGRDHFRNRAHRQSGREHDALPLRPFGQQALLRRHAPKIAFVAL